MKLIIETGQLVLPESFEFDITVNSPAFSKEGSQSLPVSLPDKINDLILEFPTRSGRGEKISRKIPAKLEAGIMHRSGQLVIDTAQRKSGIVGALLINESDFYSKIKDVTLPDIFGKIIRDDFSQSQDKVEAWYSYIYDCMTGTSQDDFTCFPVAVNLTEETYSFLNEPDASSVTNPWALMWGARRVVQGKEAINVPVGYGITPFLWLWKMIELMFAEYDYSVRVNPFKTDAFLSQIALINNTADSICLGTLNYSDLVPSCTIANFLKFLEAKYNIHAYIYPESKTIDLVALDTVINDVANLDITSIVNGNEKYKYSENEELHLSSDTSLEGAAPATETILALAEKYTHLAVLGEDDFRNNAWKYNLVLRKSTGEYYEILRKPASSEIKKNKLGTNYFSHFTGRLNYIEHKAEDLMPVMVEIKLGISGSKEITIICPYIGPARHRNTSYKDQNSNVDQKIIIALYAGPADENNVIEAKYILGTTQKFNNLGTQWSLYDLTLSDIYPLFWKEWNKILMNSGVSIEAQIDYTPEQLLSLRLDKPVLLKGQKLLIKNLSYTVGQKLNNGKSEFYLLRCLTPLIEDIEVSFLEQIYRWNYESNADVIFSPFDTQEWDSYTWEFTGQTAPSSSAFEYVPAPTAAQFASGALFYYQENEIRIYARKLNDPIIYTYDRTLTGGFRAVLISE